MKLSRAYGRDKKIFRKKYGHRESGRSCKLIVQIKINKALKLKNQL